jgi:hypothetical protein
MKRIFTVITVVLLSLKLWAQAPQRFSYQAVVRGLNNELVSSKQVGMQISLLQGTENGNAVYVETHKLTSNTNGLVSLSVGGGTFVSGSFSNVDWSKGPYFVKSETDPTGGTNYTLITTTQLLSVPYALYAKNSKISDSISGKQFFWNEDADSSVSYYGIKIGARNNFLINGININKSIKDSREIQGVTTNLQSTSASTGWVIGSKNIVQGQGKGVHAAVFGSGGKDINYAVAQNVRFGVYGMSTDTLSFLDYNNGIYAFASGNKKFNIGIDGTSGSVVGDNYGTQGWAWGKTPGSNYGLYGYSAQATTANYGVYGEVDKSVVTGIKYSGFFKGAPLGIADDNIYVKDFSKGVILTSPDGKCHQIKVDNAGVLSVVLIDCPK